MLALMQRYDLHRPNDLDMAMREHHDEPRLRFASVSPMQVLGQQRLLVDQWLLQMEYAVRIYVKKIISNPRNLPVGIP